MGRRGRPAVSRRPDTRRPQNGRQGAASDQNFGYQTEGSSSKATVTHPSQEVTRASLREYAAVQRERYCAPRGRRFHGSVALDATRVGRDAGRIGDEVIAHLAGLVGARVKVTLEIEADIPGGRRTTSCGP